MIGFGLRISKEGKDQNHANTRQGGGSGGGARSLLPGAFNNLVRQPPPPLPSKGYNTLLLPRSILKQTFVTTIITWVLTPRLILLPFGAWGWLHIRVFARPFGLSDVLFPGFPVTDKPTVRLLGGGCGPPNPNVHQRTMWSKPDGRFLF